MFVVMSPLKELVYFEYFDTFVCSLRVVELQKTDRSLMSMSWFKAGSDQWLLCGFFCVSIVPVDFMMQYVYIFHRPLFCLSSLVVTGGHWWSLGAGDKVCVVVVAQG